MNSSQPNAKVLDLLDRRAARLAVVDNTVQERELIGQVIVLLLGGERFGFPSRSIREIHRLESLTPLPGMPAECWGLTHLRGELLTVADIRPLLGVATNAKTELLAVLAIDSRSLAIPVEELIGFRTLYRGDLVESPREENQSRLVRGTTKDLASLLDTEILLSRPELQFGRG